MPLRRVGLPTYVRTAKERAAAQLLVFPQRAFRHPAKFCSRTSRTRSRRSCIKDAPYCDSVAPSSPLPASKKTCLPCLELRLHTLEESGVES